MKRNLLFPFIVILLISLACVDPGKVPAANKFITYSADPQKQEIRFYWKNEKNEIFGSLGRLEEWLSSKNRKLVFATNGGMYGIDRAPVGLYIEDFKKHRSLNTAEGKGNFHLKPNGVFYLTAKNIPVVCKTEEFKNATGVRYATQSGPMLLIDGQINPIFSKDSKNLNIRNGVGIMPGNKVAFVMSEGEVSFYELAEQFSRLGCKNALYLDGFVSRTYAPEQGWRQKDGDFGVIIGVSEARQ
jgi:uncharacterized protein YigE (DUF2233 family)